MLNGKTVSVGEGDGIWKAREVMCGEGCGFCSRRWRERKKKEGCRGLEKKRKKEGRRRKCWWAGLGKKKRKKKKKKKKGRKGWSCVGYEGFWRKKERKEGGEEEEKERERKKKKGRVSGLGLVECGYDLGFLGFTVY